MNLNKVWTSKHKYLYGTWSSIVGRMQVILASFFLLRRAGVPRLLLPIALITRLESQWEVSCDKQNILERINLKNITCNWWVLISSYNLIHLNLINYLLGTHYIVAIVLGLVSSGQLGKQNWGEMVSKHDDKSTNMTTLESERHNYKGEWWCNMTAGNGGEC